MKETDKTGPVDTDNSQGDYRERERDTHEK
jgi:hypothetical protein